MKLKTSATPDGTISYTFSLHASEMVRGALSKQRIEPQADDDEKVSILKVLVLLALDEMHVGRAHATQSLTKDHPAGAPRSTGGVGRNPDIGRPRFEPGAGLNPAGDRADGADTRRSQKAD